MLLRRDCNRRRGLPVQKSGIRTAMFNSSGTDANYLPEMKTAGGRQAENIQ